MNYQTESITMWFDRRLVIRRSSIHGIGTFATHDIDAGELLMLVTGGLIVRSEDRQPDKLHLAADMYNEETLAEDTFIVTPKLFHYDINHSCDPNAVGISRRANFTNILRRSRSARTKKSLPMDPSRTMRNDFPI